MNKVKLKGYIGIGLLIIMFISFFAWETYGRNALMYQKAVAFDRKILKGEVISEEDVKVINIEKDVIKGVIKDPKTIVGKATLVDIPEDMPVSKTYFGDADITPLKDQFIFEIPSEWIYGIPQSIRAKDIAFFYEVKEGQSVNESIVEENDIFQVEEDELLEYVLSVNVKYVKDGSNREVVNVGNDRSDGSSKVSAIEVIGTLEDLDLLKKKVEDGSKFIILYKE